MFHSLRKRLSIVILVFFLCCSFISCSQPAATQAPYAPSVWAKDFAAGQLQAHYEKHREEFGDITIEGYLYNARALLNARPGQDVLEKRRDNGDILHYRFSTGEFAVMTRHGRIRTYFKTNYNYWARQ